ncbi:uncharacterized protein STEHIDRAFT_109056 [Stereum hirsutum FP-91666 SS1]|uniref:uncharacterized protein n=1 Tax=Stereum hirsutum (strain FP-91666) TaxID=721885 RepID=UPI000440C872|nr:uncharacterized protein STEHIDRAFT_109056 [Stereum hirsutum FP-91666 SS1]EIM88697.1 hypothetical protein STEHIDRAFT_109056 [Stereum hirsutum FP-91666 SS1]
MSRKHACSASSKEIDYVSDVTDPNPYGYTDKNLETPPPSDHSGDDYCEGDPFDYFEASRSLRSADLRIDMAGGVAFHILLRWCILTHEPWKDEHSHRIEATCVQEAHLIDRKTSRKSCEIFEKIWCIPKGRFRLHSPLNIVPLRADWHRGLDCRGWVMLPLQSTLVAINENLKKSPKNAAAVAPWVQEDGKTNYQRHQYMFIPLDERSRTIPIATRKLSKDPKGEGIVTQGGTKDDLVFHDGAAGLRIHSLAHPFPVIRKAVKMFGEHTSMAELADNPSEHATCMVLAQMIYSRWLKLAGGEKALNRRFGEDESDEDGADAAANEGDRSGSKQERDEFDPSGNDEDRLEDALNDGEAPNGDPYSIGPHRQAFDIPEDAPSLVSDSSSAKAPNPTPGPDYSKSIALWVGPLPRLHKTTPLPFYDEDSESEDEENGKRPSRLMPSESRKVLLDRWFNNDFKVADSPISVAEARSAHPAKVVDPSYEEDRPVGSKRRRALTDDA